MIITQITFTASGSANDDYGKVAKKAHWVLHRGGMIQKALQGDEVGRSGEGVIDVIYLGAQGKPTDEQLAAAEAVEAELRRFYPDAKVASIKKAEQPPSKEGTKDA